MSDTYDSDAQRMTREQLEYAYAQAMRANAMALQASEVFYRVERRDSQIIGNLKRDLLAEKARTEGLAREALCKRTQADAALRLQEFDHYASQSEKEGNYRSVLLDEWTKARDAHTEAVKATDAAGWLKGSIVDNP